MKRKNTKVEENKKLRAKPFDKLRARAEKVLTKRIGKMPEIPVLPGKSGRDLAKGLADDSLKVLHELGVHQIELEMQNEELRRAHKELEESRNQYAELYDFAPVGYFTFDKNGLVVRANLTGCYMLGVERANLIKKPFHTFVSKESQDKFYLHRHGVTITAARQSSEITLVRKDKTTLVALFESIPAKDDKGKFTLCRTAITDITEHKRVEETLRQNAELKHLTEELKRYNKDLELFANVTSHDLREPLRAIDGFVRLLKERYSDKLNEKAGEYIKYTIDSVKRMDDLLTGLLEYARILTQSRPYAVIPSRGALREAVSRLQNSIEQTGTVITSDELPDIRADGQQFIQLLQNLIDNAIKFRSDKKPEIHVGFKKQNNDLQFFVSDNGIGIAPEFHDRIFQMFQRLHPRDKYSGYGTGLTICRRIVERHGGQMWVESQPGQGAIFYFTIPGK